MGKSARIQRREACKTGNTPDRKYWEKTTKFGDYRNIFENYKYLNEDFHFDKGGSSEVVALTSQHNLLHQCRTIGTHGKHVGSKPQINLKNAVKRVSKTMKLYNKTLQTLKNIGKEVSNSDK